MIVSLQILCIAQIQENGCTHIYNHLNWMLQRTCLVRTRHFWKQHFRNIKTKLGQNMFMTYQSSKYLFTGGSDGVTTPPSTTEFIVLNLDSRHVKNILLAENGFKLGRSLKNHMCGNLKKITLNCINYGAEPAPPLRYLCRGCYIAFPDPLEETWFSFCKKYISQCANRDRYIALNLDDMFLCINLKELDDDIENSDLKQAWQFIKCFAENTNDY